MSFRPATKSLIFLVVALAALLFPMFLYKQELLLNLGEAYRRHHEQYVIATRMRQSTDDLSRLARTYAVTGDKKFMTQFDELIRKRDGRSPEPAHYERIYWDFLAVDDGKFSPETSEQFISYDDVLERSDLTKNERDLLQDARRQSDLLTTVERQVFETVTGPVPNPSLQRLFNAEYHQKKIDILSKVNEAFETIDARAGSDVMKYEAALQRVQLLHFLFYCAFLFASTTWVFLAFRNHRKAIEIRDRQVDECKRTELATSQKLQSALAEIKSLEELISICAYCHSIRDEDGIWRGVEDYISKHSKMTFTHGMCPDCYDKELRKLTGTPTPN